ncbi:MAG: CinA family protein [Candidatus Omnitrophica bacterium]|nr:CinA family protein [Candidatus Omnitrophota bacterium]
MEILKNLISFCKSKKITISCAESCSGGYLSYLLTKVAGSSQVFKGSIIAYSLEAKNKFFGIKKSLLKKNQGVSKKIALFLAKNIRLLFNTDIGCSIVGFAGPTSKNKVKIGTVFIAVSNKYKTIAKKEIIEGGRDYVRKKVSLDALKMIFEILKSH